MLMFNVMQCIQGKSFGNLNTSHVNVQYVVKWIMQKLNSNLNTSHVNVQLSIRIRTLVVNVI